MDDVYIGALDIGGTKIAATVAGPQGPLARATEMTVKTGQADALPRQAMMLLDTVCNMAHVDPAALAAVGVASCGPFVTEEGMLALATPNICGGRLGAPDLPNSWESIPLERVLRERYAKVAIQNDCVAALSAERTFGAVCDERNCAYVTWSTGIGFGLCVDGNILHGKNGNAGHAGHMLMAEDSDALCGCGNRGDLEALISGRNVGIRANMSAAELFNAARQGDAEAEAAAMLAARRFGRALYNLTAALDLRVFVVGGSVWAHHGSWLKPIVEKEIASRFPALTAGVTLTDAALGNLVADVGALSLVVPKDWIPEWRRIAPWQRLQD